MAEPTLRGQVEAADYVAAQLLNRRWTTNGKRLAVAVGAVVVLAAAWFWSIGYRREVFVSLGALIGALIGGPLVQGLCIRYKARSVYRYADPLSSHGMSTALKQETLKATIASRGRKYFVGEKTIVSFCFRFPMLRSLWCRRGYSLAS